MSPAELVVQEHLRHRRSQLAVLPDLAVRPELVGLLLEVDSALERLDTGEWGLCSVCHDTVDSDRLLRDPLESVCLGCLTDAQRGALEYDLVTASQIQTGLLPPARLEIPGWSLASVYQPHGAVSGDYLDVVDPGDGRPALLAFGDVAGKGVAAAMVMSHLHALLRTLSLLDPSLPELLERISAMLLSVTTANRYATLVVARLSEDGTVEVANGGHLPPLVVRAAGVEAMPVTGVPVGLLPDVQFTTHTVHLERGDALWLFTDGVSEAPDVHGSEFGSRRVQSLAGTQHGKTPEQAVHAALDDLSGFLDGSPTTDDLTLMVAQRV